MKKEDFIQMADTYEVKSFIDNDPIQFCHKYIGQENIEIAGIISAWLSFGKRTVFIPKIDYILTDIMENELLSYILGDEWKKYEDDYTCLYRLLTWHNFYSLCSKLHKIYQFGTLESYIYRIHNKSEFPYYHQILCHLLSGETMIPTENSLSANKRMNMFLRWMIRKGSEVDLGIWNGFDTNKLLIPCDTHVLSSAKELGLISKVEETLKVAVNLTNRSKEIFGNDPARMDFALYGYGINKNK